MILEDITNYGNKETPFGFSVNQALAATRAAHTFLPQPCP
jgi:hypothetical protein